MKQPKAQHELAWARPVPMIGLWTNALEEA